MAVAAATRLFGRTGRGLAVSAVVGTTAGALLGATTLSSLLVFAAGASARVAFPWLIGIQGLAGIAEGALTAVAVTHLARRTDGFIAAERRPAAPLAQRAPRSALAWTAIAIGIAVLLVPLASSAPDALERLAPLLVARQ
jgi:hypothetical protein